MANEKRLIDQGKVYQLACAGCTRHGETLGECNHDEPCERLIFAFTVAEPVDAVEVVRCKDCKHYQYNKAYGTICNHPELEFDVECYAHWLNTKPDDFCSYGERRDGE